MSDFGGLLGMLRIVYIHSPVHLRAFLASLKALDFALAWRHVKTIGII